MKSVLFRLQHVKLPIASMGLQPLIRDAAAELERLQKGLEDIARQPEGDEQSAQAIARELLGTHTG